MTDRPRGPARLELTAVTGIGEVAPGDDLAGLLIGALAARGESLRDGDIVVVSSKVVSKAEGRTVAALDREAQIAAATVRPVASRRTPAGLARIVESEAGPVMAAAGVDASNVAPGTVLLLPKDPDGSARALRERLHRITGAVAGVVISDTAGRAWRDGQTDFALGAAGVTVVDDLRGAVDPHGQRLDVTVRALADELAAAGDLVKGKLTGAPAAILRGLSSAVTVDHGPGAAALLRPTRDDWFRLGHVEAVRAALGVPDGAVAPPSIPPAPAADRLARVVAVAMTGTLPWAPALAWTAVARVTTVDGEVTVEPAQGEEGAGPVVLGALAQRLAAAAWSEDLPVRLTLAGPRLTVTAS